MTYSANNQYKLLFFKAIFITLVSLWMPAAEAAEATEATEAGAPALDKAHLEGLARADGARVGFALVCRATKNEIETLAVKQEAFTLALAKENALPLDSGAYRGHAKVGLDSILQRFKQTPPNKEEYDENCREILSGVKNWLAD